jgi:hypothetical protein
MTIMTRDEARALEGRVVDRLRAMGIIEAQGISVPGKYGTVELSVDYSWDRKMYKRHRVPADQRDYGLVVITGQYRSSTPPKRKRLHREVEPAIAQIVREVNASVADKLPKKGERLMDTAQKDFDRGWCAHRRGIECKLINGTFHALLRAGTEEIWQDDVEYAPSHDTLVFRSEIGKLDRWITIEALQKLLDRGVLLNPKEVTFV